MEWIENRGHLKELFDVHRNFGAFECAYSISEIVAHLELTAEYIDTDEPQR